jgi:ADP-dependent NAD(P)H-hydrate dehydratase / NAD(P)H-hydrate epimerase
MRTAHAVQEVRAAESALMATMPAGTLMARAAAGLASTCLHLLGGGYGARVVLLVGTGDNGGDALYAGARLAARGARVDALLVGDRAHPGGAAALARAGGNVHAAESAVAGPPVQWLDLVRSADLVVDGVLGIGGRGGLREPAAGLAAAAADSGAWRVAVDLPSGVDADTGAAAGAAFGADVTVTFGCLKPGLLVDPGHRMAGVLELVDIGLGATLPPDPAVLALEADDVEAAWPYPGPGDDKYTRGVLGVVAGSTAYPGAAVLCVGGALGAGAGMVRFAGDAAVAATVHARWPEVVVGRGRVQAWVVGPGMGTDEGAAGRVREVLDSDVPVLVDADALTVLAAHPEWVRERATLTVLTPHDREYERFGRPVGPDRIEAARALAADLGACVLLKGSTTVVAQPGGAGAVYVNPTGTGWLATAGSGDVLSGVAGALLAAGLGETALPVAAFVHGLAGRLAADGAPAPALAVAESVPAAVRALAGDRGRIGG